MALKIVGSNPTSHPTQRKPVLSAKPHYNRLFLYLLLASLTVEMRLKMPKNSPKSVENHTRSHGKITIVEPEAVIL